MKHVLVVGGRIAGLLTAWALVRCGVEGTVFEQGPLPNPRSSSFDEHRIIRHAYGAMTGYTRLMPDTFRLWDRDWHELSIRSLDELGVGHREVPLDEVGGALPDDRARRARARGGDRGAGMMFPASIMTALVAALPGMGVRLAAFCTVTEVDPEAAIVHATASGTGRMPWWPSPGLDRPPCSLAGRGRRAVAAGGGVSGTAAGPRRRLGRRPVMLNRGAAGGTYTLPPRQGTRLKVGDHVFSRRGDPDGDRVARPQDLELLLPALRVAFRDIDRYAVLERRACFYTVAEDERFIVRSAGARAWVISVCSGHGFKLAPPWPRRSRRRLSASAIRPAFRPGRRRPEVGASDAVLALARKTFAARENRPGDAWLARFEAGRDEATRLYLGDAPTDRPTATECRSALRRRMPELLPH